MDAAGMERLEALATLIQDNQEHIIEDWRRRVRELPEARQLDRPTLDDSVGVLLDEISNALIAYVDSAPFAVRPQTGPLHHGVQRFELGFNITHVIVEYNILRQVLLDCAEDRGLVLSGQVRRALHRMIDEAIAGAAATYAATQAASIESRIQ